MVPIVYYDIYAQVFIYKYFDKILLNVLRGYRRLYKHLCSMIVISFVSIT